MFARGFKAYCEAMVQALRREVGAVEDKPLDMGRACDFLHIPVYSLADLLIAGGVSRDAPHVNEIYDSVSAFTTFEADYRTIVYNDDHTLPRHRSNLAHEIAHALLLHPPEGPGVADADHERHEAEATWLCGVLMLTAAQARRLVLQGMSSERAQLEYQISAQMLRYRINVTGASKLGRSFASA